MTAFDLSVGSDLEFSIGPQRDAVCRRDGSSVPLWGTTEFLEGRLDP
ncbi:hypothetical protein KV112_16145 [Mycolicibacter sp. MYC123]|uniref:Uncharacterized protein n=1 Tax=[Mycobacterium] zoologicum TaxID=2872311 RepID=A0ABU5YMF5_9MYCO|nr:hypothetical protein [Mycolicibacter sp. MYC101]MEB3051252.1 hypothetical protein [Mycolicibacter sp. MYC123]MEB3064904.1 hypothetical protein [Mycolicibacter sp. MYC101]